MEQDITIEDVFSLRRPKDIKAGIASGLKSVAKGVVGGTVGLLAAPAVGAVQEGLPGFAKGVAAGVAGAVLLPVAGASVAAIQVARGILNQPEAITESIKGKAWDQEHRCWVDQPVSAIRPYDAAAAAHWHRLGITAPLRSRQQQVDYYELLEVPRDAQPEHIKRQYYKLARKHHPDKNGGNAEAHMRFQQLGEAYQVLSNPELRQRYDKHGLDGVQEGLMDAAAFFTCLFGSEMFDHLIGELAIATVARFGEEAGPAELQQAQAHRVQQLTVYLTALLRRYVEGDEQGFKLAMQQEAERLASASFGVNLLHCLGAVYSMQADIYLGGLLGSTLARVKQGTDCVRSHLVVANAALKVLSHQDKLAAFDAECERRRQQPQQQLAIVQHTLDTKQQQQTPGIDANIQADMLYDSVWFGKTADGSATVQELSPPTQLQQLQEEQQVISSPNNHTSVVDAVSTSGPGKAGAPAATASAADTTSLGCVLDRLSRNGYHVAEPSATDESSSRRSSSPTATAAGVVEAGSMRNYPVFDDTADDSCSVHGSKGPSTAAPAAAAAELPSVADAQQCRAGSATTSAEQGPHPCIAGDTGANTGSVQVAMDELLHRSELEDLSVQLCMEAMWAANVVDIQQTVSKVCQAVLHDAGSSKAVCHLRAEALRELGVIFCSVSELQSTDTPHLGAKQQVQAAYEAMLAKQLAEQDAAEEHS